MKKIEVQPLTTAAFQPYGDFRNLLEPKCCLYENGQPQFYSDLQRIYLGGNTNVAVSVGLEQKREENIIEFAEFHSKTDEAMLPLDGDVIVYFAPAMGKKMPPFEKFEAFLIPKGTLVTVRQGVWHGCQLPVQNEYVRSLILLPPMTYANDTYCYFFEEEQKIWIG